MKRRWLRTFSFTQYLGAVALLMSVSTSAFAQNHKGLTFQAVVKDSGGTPVNDVGLTINVRVLSPNDCILLEENHTGVNITNGYLYLVIGKGTRAGADPAFTLKDVLSNYTARPGLTADAGGACTYTPAGDTQDARKLKVTFVTGAQTVAATLNIRGSAFAVDSETVGGKSAAEFIQTTTDVTQARVNALLAPNTYNNLIALDSGSTSAFELPSGTTAQRPAGTLGQIRFNSQTGNVEFFNGAAWTAMNAMSVGTGAGTVAAGDDSRIVGAIQNAGFTPSIQAGADGTQPAASNSGKLFFATDTQKIYRDSGTWVIMGTGNYNDLINKPTGNSLLPSQTGNGGKFLTTDGTNTSWASGGETNTTSNVGVGGVGVFKQKTGVNFELKNINAGSTKISVTNDAANNEIDLDVNQANLSIAWSQLTSVPTTLSGYGITDAVSSTTTRSANTVFAGPTSGVPAAPTFRALVAADIPSLDAAAIGTGTLAVNRGGTGQNTYTDGQLLIGNSTGNTLTKSTLTAGSNISITNGNGSITIAATGVGETNTTSNVGVGGVGVFKQKTGVNFELKNINAGSSKVSITNDAANNEIDVDVNQANLSIAWSQLTSVPTTLGGYGITDAVSTSDARLAPTPGAGNALNYIRVNAAGTAYEARTPSNTRSDISAAASGANSDITSMTAVTSVGSSGALTLSAGGSNTNVAVNPNGTGKVTIGGTTPTVNLKNVEFAGSTSGTMTMKGGSTITDYTVTWPNAKATIAGQALTSDTSGNLSWTSVGTGDALTSGNLSQFASTTSAQLAGVLSDETGTGAAVFGTSPTIATPIFTTNITAPLVIGGTGTTSTLTYKTTTGVGAAGADHIFQVGNNGATEAMRIKNDASITVGGASLTTPATGYTLTQAAAASGDITVSTTNNRNIALSPNGTGKVNVGGTTPTVNLKVLEVGGATSGTFSMKAADTTTSYSVKWPAGVAASAGQVLTSDTSGNLSWTTNASGDALTSGNLSQFASTTSAQLAGVLSDETGTGAAVFGTSPTIATPTFTTNITSPLIIGGTATTSTLTYKTTTGVGAAGADHIFQVGNNGATEVMRLTNAGTISLGGDTTLASNKNLVLQGSGALTLGTGGVTGPAAGYSITQAAAASGDITVSTTNNRNIALSPNGTGKVTVGGTNAVVNLKNVEFAGSTSGTMTMKGGSTITDYTVTWPNAKATIAGQALTSDTSGNLSWSSVGTGDALTTGNLSQFASTTSAQLAGVLSDETGTGAAVFGTSPTIATPTFTTNITSPLIIGGTATTSTLTYKTTTGVGAAGADHIFQVGNNGATEAMRIKNDATITVGGASLTTPATGYTLTQAAAASGDITVSTTNNRNIALSPNGTGKVTVGGTTPTVNLKVLEVGGATSGTFSMKAADTTTSYSVKWPAGVAASAGQVLTSDTSGNLSWTTNGAGDALTTGNLSQFASTTSAQLAGVLSDETGTGAAVFGTSPTFTTNITSPLIIGGTATTSTLTYKTTTGVGAAGADHIFQVGNNGATEVMRLTNAGAISLGGDTTLASNKNLVLQGSGAVTLGTGGVTGPAAGYSITQAAAASGDITVSTTNNRNIALSPNGTGKVNVGGTNAVVNLKNVEFAGSTSGTMTMKGGSTITDYTVTWPNAKATIAGQALTSDTSGNLSWSSVGTGDALTTGNLSQFASTTSAQLAGVLSDETGTGAAVFGTSPTIATPTFTTNITSPLIIGGTATTSTLTYKTTTGVGAAGADHIFQVGNNGATEAMRIKNDATITVGGASLTTPATGYTLTQAAAASGDITVSTTNNRNIALSPNGTGKVNVGGTTPTVNLKVLEVGGATSGTFSMKAADTTTSYSVKWPAGVAASAGQALTSDTSGNLSWTSVGTGDALTTGNLSQFASTTSAQLAGVLSDETGTGAAVFGTSPTIATPTFTTNITSPLIIGGTATTSTLTYKTTTGVGAAGADHIFQVGNNGATEVMRLTNAGAISLGGDTTLASNKNLVLQGSGAVTLGTGGVTGPAAGYSITQAAAASGDITVSTTNNRNIALSPNGTGKVNVGGTTPTVNLKVLEVGGATSGTFSMKAADTTTSYSVKWPAGVAASAGQVLTSDTSGNLSWTTNASGDALTTGNLSQFASTTSAQLAGVLSDETGSGAAVFGTSPTIATPTFTTNITSPLIIGGTATTSTLTYKTTTGVGAAGADHIFQVGNNGATEAMRIKNDASITVGGASLTTPATGYTLTQAAAASGDITVSTTNNRNIALSPNGTGKVTVGGTNAVVNLKNVEFAGSTSGTMTMKGGSTITDYTVTWPNAKATIAGQALTSDTSGNLSWSSVGTGDALTTGNLSQFASTTSAQLAGILSDETGTGAVVLGTSPTFTTNITTPLVIGGTGTTSTLTYKTTTGVGAAGADHIFQVGNNGATEAMRILNSGNVGIGVVAPGARLDVGGNQSIAPSATGKYLGLSAVTLTDSTTAASGTAAANNFNTIAAPTLAATNASVTTTDSATFKINGAPIKGTNNTVSNAVALDIGSTNVGAQSSSYGLRVAAQTGATNNYAASFTGGNVGIGTTSPTTRLYVETTDTTAANLLTLNTSGANGRPKLRFETGGSDIGTIGFLTAGSYNMSVMNDSNAALILGVNANEFSRIDPGGKFGIGTNAPSTRLHVVSGDNTYNAATAAMLLVNSDVTNGESSGLEIQAGNNSSDYPLRVKSRGGTDLLAVRGDGSVGIGTAVPDTKLHIVGTSGTTLKIVDGNQAAGRVLTSDANGVASWSSPWAPRVVTVADATTITPNSDTSDQVIQVNTQATGTLTMAAPTGTPVSGQKIIIRIKSTNVQTFSWNAAYRGSTDLPLPTASTGTSKTDYMGFIYNAEDGKWDLIASVAGF